MPELPKSAPARWGLLEFIRAVLLLRLRLLRLLTRASSSAVQIAVGTAGPQPRLPGRSGHCRTSTASSRSQWALPDLNRDFQIAVCTAGPQPRLPDRSGHCRTSTGRMSEKMSDRISEDMPDRMPERMSERMSEDMPDRMSEDMPERMSEDMSDRMSEDMPDRMPEKMSEDMPDRMPEDLPVRKCINVMVGIIRSEVLFFKHIICRLTTWPGMVPRHEEMKREQGKVELRGAERLVSWLTAGWLCSTGWKLEVLFFFNQEKHRETIYQYIISYIIS